MIQSAQSVAELLKLKAQEWGVPEVEARGAWVCTNERKRLFERPCTYEVAEPEMSRKASLPETAVWIKIEKKGVSAPYLFVVYPKKISGSTVVHVAKPHEALKSMIPAIVGTWFEEEEV